MTSNRAYRDAMAHDDAVAELVSCSGTQFDPGVVTALVSYLGGGPTQPRFKTAR
jgi:HD-GYP domain-containing protein (c-di-GMP phosphodiesterase class II)